MDRTGFATVGVPTTWEGFWLVGPRGREGGGGGVLARVSGGMFTLRGQKLVSATEEVG